MFIHNAQAFLCCRNNLRFLTPWHHVCLEELVWFLSEEWGCSWCSHSKGLTVTNPSASSAHCCLCAVMDLWLWGGVLKSSYLGNAHGTCCCFIPVESLVGPLLLLCLRMGIALWLLQLFGGFIFSYLTYNLKNNPARFQCMSCVCRAKSLLLFGKLPSQLLITATFFPTSKYLIKLAIGFLSTFSTTNRLQICLADQLWIFLGLTQHSLLQPG